MTVYFQNPGHLDLDVIRVMGASVKTTENPIGYFGTGLKYAISVLLRTGHQIRLTTGGQTYEISARPGTIRGEPFFRVYLGDEPLAFTTELGKNWEVWQAYRELHSNTLDEGGTISEKPGVADTTLAVTGAEIAKSYVQRHSIFLASSPVAADDTLEIHNQPSNYIYYRGVRVADLKEPSRFTYNLLQGCILTEDRTLRSIWDATYEIARHSPALAAFDMAAEMIAAGQCFERNLSYTLCHSPSEAFLDAAVAAYNDVSSNPSARELVGKYRQDRAEFTPAQLTERQQRKLQRAIGPLAALGCRIDLSEVSVVETLGPSLMGLYNARQNKIYLAVSTLDWGLETVIATIYEEWLHREHKLQDESREMQNFLFQKLATMAVEME